ncbi:amidase [Telmatocola sphagniphila]|uniref:Amidase n=1 Tax=Telmatocola sphagniphila TaxID=1123043 RepID=A0A8E6B2E1_9BACT|nr:amidase [Telmatocola sphagniphila]QVL30436.1 amidase [Telmatocola sphagniphila]
MNSEIDPPSLTPSRRSLLKILGALGIGSLPFQRSVAAQAQQSSTITEGMIQQAEWISGIKLDEAARKSIVRTVNGELRAIASMRGFELTNAHAPALSFQPEPWKVPSEKPNRGTVEIGESKGIKKPASEEELAFLPVTALGELIRTKQVTSLELTKLYLSRLKKYDPALLCVVTLTEELALKQAAEADKEIAAGKYRGPLHGIPWGAKDLISYPGYKTTWGATPYKEQLLKTKATVAQRLDDAGAVLVAKLTLGALAMGDQWFGGMTRNPWNVEVGSSGSSAGSACAAVAGLVGFAIGTETLGSIISPSTRCGASGLRPTFGRVSRAGCMALAWSMDKLGPIARSLEDCALILGVIHGADGLDNCAVDRPFNWPGRKDLKGIKVGYAEGAKEVKDRTELQVLKELGVELIPLSLPNKVPMGITSIILNAECASAFDDLTRKGVTEGLNSWPEIFRGGQFISAVEYLRANRLRAVLMEEMAKIFEKVDMYVGIPDLGITNLTGHPTAVMPNGFRKMNEISTPTAITFTGRLYGESDLLAVASAYQKATGHHLKHPPMDKVVVKEKK